MKHALAKSNRQQGVALFISLVLLLVLTIIGVSSVQTTSLEVRMTGNEHNTMLAFQAAESALRDAEAQLETVVALGAFTQAGTNGLYEVADLGDPEHWQAAAVWTGANSRLAPTQVDGVAEQPYAAAASDRVEMFRITARGVGGNTNARVLLQSNYGRILD